MQSPVCRHDESFPSTTQTSDLYPLVYPGQYIPPPSADFQPSNEELECLWLPEGNRTRSPCNRRFASRMDLIDHLNHSHGVNGTAKRKIRCHWFLDVNNLLLCGREVCRASFPRHIDTHLKTAFACPHLGCAKYYSRHDVLRKHLKTHAG
ncbi:hypothetical protein EDD16DRAFT_1650091 [Pisolithus croceorrhizus]|nr:hypothetical protein EDD16DRAFT_1650091 [Pisolithus croceorrhizus]KAI6159175.1 hypothetical protein EDD17DRAFT_916324 [Pisolithus thermaeus]